VAANFHGIDGCSTSTSSANGCSPVRTDGEDDAEAAEA
jgi:hypothetical protein